jgi:hypothetical protein
MGFIFLARSILFYHLATRVCGTFRCDRIIGGILDTQTMTANLYRTTFETAALDGTK